MIAVDTSALMAIVLNEQPADACTMQLSHSAAAPDNDPPFQPEIRMRA